MRPGAGGRRRLTGAPTCPVCGWGGKPFFELLGVPVYCNVLWPTREQAVHAARGDICLAVCESCGMIWNTTFDPATVDYGVEYENSLHFSPVFQHYAAQLAERLVVDRRLEGKHVVDFGCGKGDFLALVCAGGRSHGTGFDPSYDGAYEGVEWLRFVRDVYSDRYAEVRGDLVTCRHVLEHVVEPRGFASMLHGAVAVDGSLYVEVPSAEHMLRRGAVWDLIYEHCSYFTAPALARLLRDAGFDVVRTGTSYGDQYLWMEAVVAPRVRQSPRAGDELGELAGLTEQFRATFREAVSGAATELARWSAGGSVALWGAGSKGVTFLNVADPDGRIAAVVDVNPRKRGRHVAGSGQRILSPEDLSATRPGTVLVTNPQYSSEIERLVREVGVRAQVVLV